MRTRVLAAIARIAKAEAAAAGAPKEPSVTVGGSGSATYNDPALARRIAGVLGQAFGAPNVMERVPQMGAGGLRSLRARRCARGVVLARGSRAREV